MNNVIGVFLSTAKTTLLSICFVGGLSTITFTVGTAHHRTVYEYNWFQSFFRSILWPFEATNWAAGFNEANFIEIREGMTQQDVIKLVGQPLNKHCSEQFNQCTWYYTQKMAGAHLFDRREIHFSRAGVVIEATKEFYIDQTRYTGVPVTPESQQHFPPLQLIVNSKFFYEQRYKDASFLHQKYIVERRSIAEIAQEIFSSESTVHKYLKIHGIPLREPKAIKKYSGYGLAFGRQFRRGGEIRHKKEEAVIAKMSSLREQGFSYWKIADVLNTMKVPTKTGRGRWHSRSVQAILDRNTPSDNS